MFLPGVEFMGVNFTENYQQNGVAELNGHIDDREQVKPCDIVYITGKPENCETAKQSLLDIVPITEEVRFRNNALRNY